MREGEDGGRVHILKERNQMSVMGCELRRKLSWPGLGFFHGMSLVWVIVVEGGRCWSLEVGIQCIKESYCAA